MQPTHIHTIFESFKTNSNYNQTTSQQQKSKTSNTRATITLFKRKCPQDNYFKGFKVNDSHTLMRKRKRSWNLDRTAQIAIWVQSIMNQEAELCEKTETQKCVMWLNSIQCVVFVCECDHWHRDTYTKCYTKPTLGTYLSVWRNCREVGVWVWVLWAVAVCIYLHS